jgi:DNA-binding CsgD family transcriptional regulator
MCKATISADIMNSTSLNEDDTVRLSCHLKTFVSIIEKEFSGCWGRIVRGDGLEIVLPHIKDVMRVAVMLKCHVKALNVEYGAFSMAGRHRRIPHFGVRVAIGIGKLRLNDRANGLIDGDAIYYSGRMLERISSRRRGTLVLVGWDGQRRETAQALLSLMDVIVMHATAKQCDIMVKRFLGMSESLIAKNIGITQSAVNTHLRRAGWHALASAVDYFENGLCR